LFSSTRRGRPCENNTLYAVLPLDDEHGHTDAFAVARAGQEEPYQVSTAGWRCDCSDAVYRGRACKHAHIIRASFDGRVP
jgi:hypothetical protein